MNPTPLECVALVVLGGLLTLDESVSPSLLLAQPLVTGVLGGALLGEPESGLVAGALLQLLWMGQRPVGGAVAPDGVLGGLAATLCMPKDIVLQGNAWLDDPRLAVPVLVGLGAAHGGRALVRAQRRFQERLATRVPGDLARGDLSAIERLHRLGIGMHGIRGALAAGIVVAGAAPVGAWLADLGIAAPAGRLALALGVVGWIRISGGKSFRLPLLAGTGLGVCVVLL